MFNIENLLNDSKFTFRYRGISFTLSKLRNIHVSKSVVEQCYYCLNLNEDICLCEFKAIVTMKFINYCYKMLLKHNYFDSNFIETEKFIKNSLDDCENIANLLINTSMQLSNKFNDLTHTQSLIFQEGVKQLEIKQKEDKDSNIEQAKKNAMCFTGRNE